MSSGASTIDRLRSLLAGPRDAAVHLVGAASLETGAVCRYLAARGFSTLILHDLHEDFAGNLARSHRYQPRETVAAYQDLVARIGCVRSGARYLAGIAAGDIVCAPQSWFLHRENDPLAARADRPLQYLDFCLALFRGTVIGVTGTVGKSTTAQFAATLCGARLAGNDREDVPNLAALEAAGDHERLVLEISNRHLRHGIARTLDAAVLTNICPNHIPDHGTLDAYAAMKNSIFAHARAAVAPRENPWPGLAIAVPPGVPCARFADSPPADAWYADGVLTVAGEELCSLAETGLRFDHERLDLAAAALAAHAAGVQLSELRACVSAVRQRLAYRCRMYRRGDRRVINDAAACHPENTRALVAGLTEPFVLVTGGSRQQPVDGEFDGLARAVAANPRARCVYALGPMGPRIARALTAAGYDAVRIGDDTAAALTAAVAQGMAETIVVSPGCGAGAEFTDKYERGEAIDRIIASLVPDR